MEIHRLIIKCDCGETQSVDLDEYDLNWEIIEADEREMGTESLHEALFEFECKQCNEVISVKLYVWEYPEGIANMEDIQIDGGELVESCEFGDLVL